MTRPDAPALRPMLHRLRTRIAWLARWLHIYLSMLGLFVLLFFSVTGITLNHPTWFTSGIGRTVDAEGTLDLAWVALPDDPDADPAESVDRLEVVEHLRASHGLRGAVADFTADEYECVITFKGPGYSADVFVNRETGAYQLTETSHGLVAMINDLHKGRDTGPVWSVLIDVSAGLMIVASLSGLILIFYLKRRRIPGIAVAVGGTLLVLALIWAFVP